MLEFQEYYQALRPSDVPLFNRLLLHPTYRPKAILLGSLHLIRRLEERFRGSAQGLFLATYTPSATPDENGPKETPMLVKFCSSYSAEAHELLARVGYAPKLHFCGDLVGSVTMVVMDYIKCEIAHCKFRANEPLPEQVIQA
ncbi:hypothetical protein FRB99_007382, partial [Tulasnella sp. 403]